MDNKFTSLTYFCSKDPDKIMQFVRRLPFKIEFKQMVKDKSKWFLYFTYADKMDIRSLPTELDLDKV